LLEQFQSFGYGNIEYRRQIRKLSKLGEGQFGEVWKCILRKQRPWPARHVAVKELTSGDGYQIVQEAQVMLDVKGHPNVVKFLGVCYQPPCLVLELVENAAELDKHLQGYLKTQGPSSYAAMVCCNFLDIACGVAHMHQHGILHRDLAPRNVLVNVVTRVAQVNDFGLSARAHLGIGTPVLAPRTPPLRTIQAADSRRLADGFSSLRNDLSQQLLANDMSPSQPLPIRATLQGRERLDDEPSLFDSPPPQSASQGEGFQLGSQGEGFIVMDPEQAYFRAAPENYGYDFYEEFQGQQVHTKKSDVFMMGMMMWEALTDEWAPDDGSDSQGYCSHFEEAVGLQVDLDSLHNPTELVTFRAKRGLPEHRAFEELASKLKAWAVTPQDVEVLWRLNAACLLCKHRERPSMEEIALALVDVVWRLGVVTEVHPKGVFAV